uniref:A-kinase anchor protein 17A n=1 Tax=Ascaris suum TaxID=6253 RepID=F1L0B1_ASCSU
MNEVECCTDDVEPFYEPLGLYVKPCARVNITLSLPQLKQPGQSISNWDLMEKIKKAVSPIQLSSIRVTTSTLEMVRFEAELPNRKILNKVIKALEGYSLKVVGFFESLRVRASEAKSEFPTRHDWDEFFRSAKGMNELKPGERPDTIYLAKLPSNWFMEECKTGNTLPSERLLKRVFEQFGKVRCVDIPACDAYRKQMPAHISGIKVAGFSFGQEVLFEAYVQFVEYISFMRAMDALRNMKLVKKMNNGRVFEAAIKVDFDKNKHLSDDSISRRNFERERLIEEELAKAAEERRKREEEEAQKKAEELERENRRLQREEKRRLKRQEEKRMKDEQILEEKNKREANELMLAKRRLESQRLLAELFRRVDLKKQKMESAMNISISEGVPQTTQLDLEAKLRQTLLKEQEIRLRKRIEAKMLLRLGAVEKQNDGDSSDHSHKHRKKKRKEEP